MDNRITIIGCGPGAPDLLTLRASTAILDADCVVGSQRLIDAFAMDNQETIVIDGNYKAAITEAHTVVKNGLRVAFLVSGDPLFCSLGALIVKEFGKKASEIIPGIGSIPYAFTLLKESWQDYRLLSLHGNANVDIREAFNKNDKIAILLDPEQNLKWVKNQLEGVKTDDRRFFIATNLTLPEEDFKEIAFKDLGTITEESLAILLIKKRDKHDR